MTFDPTGYHVCVLSILFRCWTKAATNAVIGGELRVFFQFTRLPTKGARATRYRQQQSTREERNRFRCNRSFQAAARLNHTPRFSVSNGTRITRRLW